LVYLKGYVNVNGHKDLRIEPRERMKKGKGVFGKSSDKRLDNFYLGQAQGLKSGLLRKVSLRSPLKSEWAYLKKEVEVKKNKI
jgi:hypothetical protein